MSKQKQIEGEFWFPRRPDTRYFGTLHLDDLDGPHLRLVGHFDGSTRDLFRKHPSIMHGETTDDGAVTLLNCASLSMTEGKFDIAEFVAELVIDGTHIGSRERASTTRMYIRYTWLEWWMNVSGMPRIPAEELAKLGTQIGTHRLGRVGEFTLSLVHQGVGR